MGFLPEAMFNYLLRLGWSHGDEEIISRDDAIRWFTLEAVGRSPARFDMERLKSLNAHYIREADDQLLDGQDKGEDHADDCAQGRLHGPQNCRHQHRRRPFACSPRTAEGGKPRLTPA